MPPEAPSHAVTSDASGSWGCGAGMDSSHWFQVEWPESWSGVSIAAKEMVPVVISAAVWGHQWAKCGVLVRLDNMVVVHCLASGAVRDPLLMHLLHCLHLVTATHQIGIEAKHVPGVHHTAADALSRNMMQTFLDTTPQAQEEATCVPPPLLDMLLHQCPDWISPGCRKMFLSSLDRH